MQATEQRYNGLILAFWNDKYRVLGFQNVPIWLSKQERSRIDNKHYYLTKIDQQDTYLDSVSVVILKELGEVG
jgi:hypothetical protein